eukprot:353079-Chlamydomonas_euryale.AAC.2
MSGSGSRIMRRLRPPPARQSAQTLTQRSSLGTQGLRWTLGAHIDAAQRLRHSGSTLDPGRTH